MVQGGASYAASVGKLNIHGGAMEISALKDKLGDETFQELESFITTLTAQRDDARRESIVGRKGLQGQVKELTAWQEKLMDKLGIETPEQVDDLPENMSGQVDAVRQLETKIKRLERSIQETTADRDGWVEKHRGAQRKAVLADALSKHDFVDRDVIEAFVSSRLAWEDDELIFKGEDGTPMSVTDGITAIAKAKPQLLRAPGARGAGVPNDSGKGGKTITRAQYDAMSADEKTAHVNDGGSITD